MFGIDGIEFLIIILVAIIVIGPKDMLGMLRVFAGAAARIRAFSREFSGYFGDIMQQTDMEGVVRELKNAGKNIKELDSRYKIRKFYASLERETELEKTQRLQAEQFMQKHKHNSASVAEAVRGNADTLGSGSEIAGDNIDRLVADNVEGRVIAAVSHADYANKNDSASEALNKADSGKAKISNDFTAGSRLPND